MNKGSIFYCVECGNEFVKWYGRCPVCNLWNTITEKKTYEFEQHTDKIIKEPVKINEINLSDLKRIDTKSIELNRVLGGGIVPGSVILIVGEPGIGKSTLMLQFALRVKSIKTLYVSSEESEHQIKMRSERLKGKGENCWLLCTTNINDIIIAIQKIKPDIVIIDSIQALHNNEKELLPGSIGSIKQNAYILMNIAKQYNIPIFIVGHVNKEGIIAGPKIIEHLVDVILVFEGEQTNSYRLLRAIKNRYGAIYEVGLFEMRQDGLKEITNPTNILADLTAPYKIGSVIGCVMEGIRPLIVETQSLVNRAFYNNPLRIINGYETKKVFILLAVIEKFFKIKMYNKEIFINIAGGFKINDQSLDLAIIVSILSSVLNIYIPIDYCFIGEVGLNGEIRSSSNIEQKISEINKIGIKNVIIPSNTELPKQISNLNIIKIGHIKNLDLKKLLTQNI